MDEIRRKNLRKLMDEHGATVLAKRLGYRSPTFLSQLAGPNPTRQVTEKTARRFEADLGLPTGYLDGRPATVDLADIIRLVGRLAEGEGVELPVNRFADVAALAVTDATEHGGVAREAHIRQVLRLLK